MKKNLLSFAVLLILMGCFQGFFIRKINQVFLKPNIAVEKEKNAEKIQYEKLQVCNENITNGQYEQALDCTSALIKDNESVSDILRFMHGIALFYNGHIKEAEQEFDFVINNSQDSELVTKSKEFQDKVLQIKNLKRRDIGHYYTDLKQTATWKNPRKIKVYISDDYGKKSLLKKAFDDWDKSLYDMVNFIYVDSPEKANIIVKAVYQIELDQIGAAGVTNSMMGFYPNNPNVFYIQNSEILIAIDNENGNLIGDRMFYGVVLHEIGHALGIVSHSPSIGDAMYYSTNSYALGRITNRDVNTVKRIYGNI